MSHYLDTDRQQVISDDVVLKNDNWLCLLKNFKQEIFLVILQTRTVHICIHIHLQRLLTLRDETSKSRSSWALFKYIGLLNFYSVCGMAKTQFFGKCALQLGLPCGVFIYYLRWWYPLNSAYYNACIVSSTLVLL